MLGPNQAISPRAATPPADTLRNRIAIAAVALGAALTCFVLMTGASPGTVTVPLSLGILFALIIVPFPVADRWLALGLVGTFPLVPSVGLPNVPLAAGVVGVATVRLWLQPRDRELPRWALAVLALFWLTAAVGLALSHWPPLSVWLRPMAILAVGAVASILGVLVWLDADRRDRWLDGLSIGVVAVAVSAIVIFFLQFVAPIVSVRDAVVGVMGYFRGDVSAAKFADQNNWIIFGNDLILRAVTPLFPAPNNLGGYLGVILPLAVARWFFAPAGRWRSAAAAGAWLGLLAGVLTISRSTWLAACVAIVVAAIAAFSRPRTRQIFRDNRLRLFRGAAFAALAIAIGALAIVSVGQTGVEGRLVRPLQDPSVQERFENSGQAVIALTRDGIRGVGLGNWKATVTIGDYVHNAYLEYAVAIGLFGGLWVLLLVGIPGVAGLFVAVKGPPPWSVFGLALLAGAAFSAFQFLFDDNLLVPQYAWLTFWAVGGSLALASTWSRGAVRVESRGA